MKILYRTIKKEEIPRLKEIDRRETIEQCCCLRNDQLETRDVYYNVEGWDFKEVEELITRLETLYDQGGTVYGAFMGTSIVGMTALANKFLGSQKDQLKLDILYISANCRKLGIGRKLMDLATLKAREMGATKLYISATPTRNTVDFYMSLGSQLATEVDSDLFALEPEDIHLELRI